MKPSLCSRPPLCEPSSAHCSFEAKAKPSRFQIQTGTSDPNSYKSLGHCFRTIFRNEGVFGFYKGILPPIVAETPKRACKFFCFEQYKKLLGLTPLSPGVVSSHFLTLPPELAAKT
uniref:Mitochondrial 2-oxodicarboxylate carrier n=1 Tax=Knipowitschia caucasica TaxID=637954 RepID=A0AAV2JFV6_KNICA